MRRRQFLLTSTAAAAGLALAGLPHFGNGSPASSAAYPYSLPPLPYAPDALAPYLDAQTMRIHHGKHHQGYVDKLNAALAAAPEWQAAPLERLFARLTQLPEALRTPLRNHGGGHWNHAFFWPQFAAGSPPPGPALTQALAQHFGSVEAFQEQFTQAALSIFGSGWAWLIRTPDGRLSLTTTPNQDNPLMDLAPRPGTPIFGIDVWEHAYYLAYQNRRADYLKAIWNIVHWPEIERRLAA